jgi:hypothetical protein|tara:strand:- start:1314 stop:1781 length:468 start_codon:yes stop_codon:yes gene_type:complete
MTKAKNPKTPRSSETRESEDRPQAWQPASLLPDPDPQDGWTFRWIRTSFVGQSDNKNVSQAFRAGWEPCKADDHPELMILSDVDSRFGSEGNIEVGGLLLCKIPAERMVARGEYQRQKADQAQHAVDNMYMRENDPRSPLLETERTTRKFGTGGS